MVTGVRFAKNNSIIHLQIQEGELSEYGTIKNSTLNWVKLEDNRINDTKYLDGRDYLTMDYHKRGFDLDDLTVPKDHVVVISFQVKL